MNTERVKDQIAIVTSPVRKASRILSPILEMCAEKPIYSEKIKKRSLTAKGWRKVRRAE
jgi:hypothetical protein